MASEETPPKRWTFLAAAVLIQLCLGHLYTWSIFRTGLMKVQGWAIQQTTIPFNEFSVVGMLLGGWWQDKAGPRTVAITGGIILGVGFLLTSQIGTTPSGLYIAYGLVGGLGVGLVYIPPISVCLKWFPEMRGLTAGLVLLAFGAGSTIGGLWGPVLINRIGVYGTFAAFGIIFGVTVVLSGVILRNPPSEWRPPGWTAAQPTDEYTPNGMLKNFQFYLLWFIYLFWAGVGLLTISQAVPLGVESVKLGRSVAAPALGTMAIFNALGRPALGWLSDRIGRNWAVILSQLIYIVALLLILPNATTVGIFSTGISMIGFAYGGHFALMPALTADYFGTKNFGINYSILLSASGAAAFLAPAGAMMRAATGTWTGTLFILGLLSAFTAVLAFITKVPTPREALHRS